VPIINHLARRLPAKTLLLTLNNPSEAAMSRGRRANAYRLNMMAEPDVKGAERLFDHYVAVDWSARSTPGPARPAKDSLWVGETGVTGAARRESYWRTRWECVEYLKARLLALAEQRKRVLIGYDFNFGFPTGFADALGISSQGPKWQRMWRRLVELSVDDESNANNRFTVAAALNEAVMPQHSRLMGPFWGCPIKQQCKTLGARSPAYPFATKNGQTLRRRRWTEEREPKAQPVWKLLGAGSVGGQTLVGIPAVARLSDDGQLCSVSKIWPFETGFHPVWAPENEPFILHVEIWPGMLGDWLDPSIEIRDQAQVRAMVEWMAACDASGELVQLLEAPRGLEEPARQECEHEEGWMLGSGTHAA